jgi:basic amino acid/polyamine antiporter, APA family
MSRPEPESQPLSSAVQPPDPGVDPAGSSGAPVANVGLWDALSIIVGIVVGTAIYKSPTLVFQNVAGPWQGLGVWILGGLLSFCGALCYAELATTYPRNGGDYEYLSRAFGRPVGFLFSWAQLTTVLSGSIGAMAYAFADYGVKLWSLPVTTTAWLAAAAVLALTLVNLVGMSAGKYAQNVLSGAKVMGLAGIVIAGLWAGNPAQSFASPDGKLMGPGLGLALVFVLYAFGGWNDIAFVAAEVRDQRRNLPRALLGGIAGITAIYLAVNLALITALGFDSARTTYTPASDALEKALGVWGGRGISLLVMISALGAINGMILTGSRVYARLGVDYRLFSWMASWNRRSATPAPAIAVQAVVAILLIMAVGTDSGRRTVDAALQSVGISGLPWEQYFGGFETLVAGTAPVFWSFFLLTAISLFVLRAKDRGRPRPFSAPLFPLPPIVLCLTCSYMLYSSLDYGKWLALIGLVPLALGIPIYAISVSGGRNSGR